MSLLHQQLTSDGERTQLPMNRVMGWESTRKSDVDFLGAECQVTQLNVRTVLRLKAWQQTGHAIHRAEVRKKRVTAVCYSKDGQGVLGASHRNVQQPPLIVRSAPVSAI